MSAANATTGRHRRAAAGRIVAVEYGRRAVPAAKPASQGYAAYVGRVGALAIALGVGSATGSAAPGASGDTGKQGPP